MCHCIMTTVGEMYSLLYNISVKDIFNIKIISKYNHPYVSFCVTLQDPHDMAIVFNYPWRGGIVVEPFGNHMRPDNPVALCNPMLRSQPTP